MEIERYAIRTEFTFDGAAADTEDEDGDGGDSADNADDDNCAGGAPNADDRDARTLPETTHSHAATRRRIAKQSVMKSWLRRRLTLILLRALSGASDVLIAAWMHLLVLGNIVNHPHWHA